MVQRCTALHISLQYYFPEQPCTAVNVSYRTPFFTALSSVAAFEQLKTSSHLHGVVHIPEFRSVSMHCRRWSFVYICLLAGEGHQLWSNLIFITIHAFKP